MLMRTTGGLIFYTKEVYMSEENTNLQPKPAKTYAEQLDILKGRGLYIENDSEAIISLSQLNYYRLRGYYIHLQDKTSNMFHPGVSFSHIVSLHTFDSELRLILLRLLFDLEIVARTAIAYEIGNAWGPMGYMEEANYGGCDHDQFEKLIESINSDIGRSKEKFIRTHNEKYGGNFPIWVAVEVMSFGDLSKLYGLLPPSHRANIANSFDYIDEKLLSNWIYASSILRNACAHNGRIYGRTFSVPVTIEKEMKKHIVELTGPSFSIYPNSLFAYLLTLQRIARPATWNCFLDQLIALFSRYEGIIEPFRLGFPKQWKLILLNK